MIMWYMFPWMDLCGNLPVWYVYMVFLMLYDAIIMLCLFSCWLLVLSSLLPWRILLFWCIGCLVFFLSCALFMFLQIQGEISYILVVDDWPSDIIYLSNSFDLRGFCCNYCRSMKVYYGWFNDWEFIHIIYGFWCVFGHACLYMVYCSWNYWDRIEGIYWLSSIRTV